MSKITLEINSCYDCPHVTNSSREHDCAFTPTPHPTTWWCTHKDNRQSCGFKFIIHDPYKIHPQCKVISNA